ncbi:MAG: sensor histidine kinase [Candidatus Lokiarchaeota archaeon]|nr:sensor histidine kinase [Candidatus Lokiarchaeota archaeon]
MESLVLTQYRNDSKYNDFIGKFYHFPGSPKKNYLNNFSNLPVEFVYYEPQKNNGKGEYFGYGKIMNTPFEDKRESGYYFIEIAEYKPFANPVFFKDENDKIIEAQSENYNPQNAVRKIPKKILDEICLDGGVILNIKSDAHLIKVLGEQLISSEKVGILELIKNSIDAQSSYCRIRIENIPSMNILNRDEYEFSGYSPGPVILIEDDGVGMDKNIIENGWLRPASTIKTRIKEKLRIEREKALKSGNLGSYDAIVKKLKKEYGKRIPLGEKGVGRFATHRLGRFLELRTKTKENDYELVLKIDWDKFDIISDKFVDLDSIGISLNRAKPLRNYQKTDSWTRLLIYGGRKGFEWDEQSIEELNRTILNLNSPSKSIHKKNKYDVFNVVLECPQYPDLPKKQIYQESEPNFELIVLVNRKGIAEVSELKFQHPEEKLPSEKWTDKNIDLRKLDIRDRHYWTESNGSKRDPKCGPFFISVSTWYRTKEWIDLPNYKDLTEYLEEFGGISVYRDNILICDAKLGSERDWLGLTQAHIKQGFRLSYREMIGHIEIEQENNHLLIDKTNREGFINNQAYKDLAILVRNVIDTILLPRFISKRDELSKLTKGIISDSSILNNVVKTNTKLLNNFASSTYPFKDDPYSFFNELWDKLEDRKKQIVNLSDSMKNLQKSLKMMEEVQVQFVEQAGFGIAVAISLHEINKLTSNFYHGIIELIKSGQSDKLKIEDLKSISDSLRTELKRLGPLRSIRNENRMEFKLLKSIYFAKDIFRRRMKSLEISFEVVNPEEGFQIYGRYRALNQVLANLFDNSIYWIESANTFNKKISIVLNKKYRTMIFADSGSDIDEIIRPYLFQPGYSLRIPPSGLGLYICKTYLNGMKSRIYETPQKDRVELPGAQFTLDFSKTPEYKEV